MLLALALALASAGKSSAARIAMMAMTTSSSISVKPQVWEARPLKASALPDCPHNVLFPRISRKDQTQPVKRIARWRVGVLPGDGLRAGQRVGVNRRPIHEVGRAFQNVRAIRHGRELEREAVRGILRAQIRRHNLRNDECGEIRYARDENLIVGRIEGERLRSPVGAVPLINAQIAAVAGIIVARRARPMSA